MAPVFMVFVGSFPWTARHKGGDTRSLVVVLRPFDSAYILLRA